MPVKAVKVLFWCQQCRFLLSHHDLIMAAPVIASVSSVKAANKRAEKNKKTTMTTPNSIAEGVRQFSPAAEGERATKFSIS